MHGVISNASLGSEPSATPTPDFKIFTAGFSETNYPSWMKSRGGILYRKLEQQARREYNLKRDVEAVQWSEKIVGYIDLKIILANLEGAEIISKQCGLTDFFAIQAKGIEVYRSQFAGKRLFALRSTIITTGGNLAAAYMEEQNDRLIINWRWQGVQFRENDLALQFNK